MKKLVLTLLLVWPLWMFSQEAFVINSYDVDVVIDQYGDCHITEDINLRFLEKRRGIIRKIPLNGKFKSHTQRLKIKDVKVDGYKYSTQTNRGNTEIKIGDKNVYIDGEQNYRISFTAQDGLLNFEDFEEFYWTLIGRDWDTDIRSAKFKITLPSAINLSPDDIHIFSGDFGSNTDYGRISQTDETTIEGESLTILGNGKTLTVGIRVPKGYFFDNPNYQKESGSSSGLQGQGGPRKDYALPLPLLLILGLIAAFRKWGRSKKIAYAEDRFYPPDGLSPSEVGAYIDNKVQNRDLIALIPKWGHEGIIKVKVAGKNDIYLEKLKPIASDVPDYESYLFYELFKDSDLIFVDDLRHTFYDQFNKAKSMLKKAVDPGYYDEEAISIFHDKKMILLGIGSIIVGILVIIFLQQILTGIGFILAGIAAFVIYSREPKKTERGLIVHNDLKNLQYTLSDSDALSEVLEKDPDYLDKIFPYVVALGLEDKWSERFSALSERAPNWYYYEDGRHFGYGDFNRDFRTKSIGKTFSTPPVADSSSSSFGGGGSSGGGFGGGGGSSW